MGHINQRGLSPHGFGINLHYADALALRYDRANVPTESGPTLHPWDLRFLFNPYGVVKVLLGG